MLEITGLSKSFGGFRAVSDVSLTVETRQIAAVIGPNGAGKSTLFNLITGHLQPDSGTVRLDGRDITGVAAASHLPHGDRPLVPAHQHLSQADRVREPAGRVSGASPSRREFLGTLEAFYRDETAALLASIGLVGQENTIAGTLSYGNQKQLELGLALASDPQTAAARRAYRRHVGRRNARDDPVARAHRRVSAD